MQFCYNTAIIFLYVDKLLPLVLVNFKRFGAFNFPCNFLVLHQILKFVDFSVLSSNDTFCLFSLQLCHIAPL